MMEIYGMNVTEWIVVGITMAICIIVLYGNYITIKYSR